MITNASWMFCCSTGISFSCERPSVNKVFCGSRFVGAMHPSAGWFYRPMPKVQTFVFHLFTENSAMSYVIETRGSVCITFSWTRNFMPPGALNSLHLCLPHQDDWFLAIGMLRQLHYRAISEANLDKDKRREGVKHVIVLFVYYTYVAPNFS